jgi:hypothetical protein
MTSVDADHGRDSEQITDRVIPLTVCAYAAAFVVFGFVVDTPERIFVGLIEIITMRDALLTDYFGAGGIGAACVNAGVLTLVVSFIYYKAQAKLSGASVACLFLVLGFGLFGRNILNIWLSS